MIITDSLNEHQFVKIFDLSHSKKYHYRTCFPEQAERIAQVFNPFIDALPKTFFNLENNPHRHPYDGWAYVSISDWLLRHDVSWNLRSISTGRTVLGEHPSLTELMFKIYNVRPGRAQPMANALRVPMAQLLREVSIEEKMGEDVDIPQKGFIPLASPEIINQLDENTINEALLVVVEKKKLIPKAQMLTIVKALPESTQLLRAHQLCKLPTRTGLGDMTWSNLQMTEELKITLIDTEPLYCELMPYPEGENFATKFPRNARWLHPELASESTLRKSALLGLDTFRKSSMGAELHIFEETAQRYIDKLSP